MPNQAQSLAMFRHDNCADVVERASGRLQLRRKSSTIHKFRKKKPRFSTVSFCVSRCSAPDLRIATR